MSPKVKQKQSREEAIILVKDFINAANLKELRLIDIALKERKHEIIINGIEEVRPSICLIASKICGNEYIYIQQFKDGKKTTRKLKEAEVAGFDYETVKISPEAKRVLGEKYDIHIKDLTP